MTLATGRAAVLLEHLTVRGVDSAEWHLMVDQTDEGRAVVRCGDALSSKFETKTVYSTAHVCERCKEAARRSGDSERRASIRGAAARERWKRRHRIRGGL